MICLIVMSLIIFLAVGIYTRRVPNRRLYIMAASTIPPFIGLLAMSLLPNTPEYKWTKWGMYFMTVPFVLALFLAWTLSELPISSKPTDLIVASPFQRRRPNEENCDLVSHLPRLLRWQYVWFPDIQKRGRTSLYSWDDGGFSVPWSRIHFDMWLAQVLRVAELEA